MLYTRNDPYRLCPNSDLGETDLEQLELVVSGTCCKGEWDGEMWLLYPEDSQTQEDFQEEIAYVEAFNAPAAWMRNKP